MLSKRDATVAKWPFGALVVAAASTEVAKFSFTHLSTDALPLYASLPSVDMAVDLYPWWCTRSV